MSIATCSSETGEHASPTLADQPVFIVGCGRSGTTLMRLMLSAAGGLMIPPECDFLWRAVRRFGPDATLDGRGIADFVALLGGISSFPGLELPLDQLGRELQQRGSAPLRDCIGHVYTSYATREGKSRWGDKNPFYVLYLDEIHRLYPGVRIIHMVRDGRDVAVSYQGTKMQPYSTFVTAKRWVRCVRAGQEWGARHPDQYLEVRYEDLTDSPEAQLRRVAPFIGERYSDAMLAFYLDNKDLRRIPVHDRAHHGNLAKPIMKGNREKWRTQMRVQDREMFEWVGGRLLAELGYAGRSESRQAALLPYLWTCELRTHIGQRGIVRAAVDRLPWKARAAAKKALLIDNEHYR